MGKRKPQNSLIAVPMGLEIYIGSSDPELHTRIRGTQASKIASFAEYIKTQEGGIGAGLYWADRAVVARDYLTNMSLPYLMLAGLVKAPETPNVFKLDYFRPVEINALKKGELYIWPVIGILSRITGRGKGVKIPISEETPKILAKSLEVSDTLLTITLPYIAERREIPFLEELAFKLSLERALEDSDIVDIPPVMPEEYFEGAAWPRYLPLPPIMVKYEVPNRIISVPASLNADTCRRLENAGWIVNKRSDGREDKWRTKVKRT